MAILLGLNDAYKSFGGQEILQKATLQVNDGQKIAILGRNGSGKSTLLRILLGEEEMDGGDLSHHPDLRLGYLRQHDPFLPGETVLQYLMRDSEQADWRCAEVAAEFGVRGPMLEQEVKELSGGWQTRIKLSALLLHDPNLLLLDEPTNFLDLRTQMLLEHFLINYRGALLLISHDRRFLKASCDWTCEIRDCKLTLEPGNVDDYLRRQEERVEHALRQNENLQTKRDQLQRFVDANKAGANTASQARSKARQVERIDEQMLEVQKLRSRSMQIRVPEVELRKGTALTLSNLQIGYPDLCIAKDIDMYFEYGRRIAVLGDNGQGKTTFLRSIAGTLDKQGGQIKWGHHCKVGLYAQHVYQSIGKGHTVESFLAAEAIVGTKTQQILDTAGSFLFSNDAVKKDVSVLSGGERARLCLAGLMLGDVNVLILDEPSNHLDIESVQALTEALQRYQGTIIFTSHDSDFVAAIATDVVEVKDGQVTHFPGDYDEYVYRIQKDVNDQFEDAPVAPKPVTEKVVKKSSGADAYQRAKKLKGVERRIAKLQKDKAALDEELLTCKDPAQMAELGQKLVALQEDLDNQEEQWLELQD